MVSAQGSGYQPVEIPLRRSSGEQLRDRRYRAPRPSETRPPIILPTPPTRVVDVEAENDIDHSIKRALRNIDKYGPITRHMLPILKEKLKKLNGPALLKLSLLQPDILIHCNFLFKRLCRREAGITTRNDEVTWNWVYAKFYFKNRPNTKFRDWETELLNREAYLNAHEKIRHRDQTRAKILKTDIPEYLVPSNQKLNQKREESLAKKRGVRVVRQNTNKAAAHAIKISDAEENTKNPVRMRNTRPQNLRSADETLLWKKCKKQRASYFFPAW